MAKTRKKQKDESQELRMSRAAFRIVSEERDQYKKSLETLAEVLRPFLGIDQLQEKIDDLVLAK